MVIGMTGQPGQLSPVDSDAVRRAVQRCGLPLCLLYKRENRLSPWQQFT